jgi:uncharacterized protein (DUF2147 family)
MSPFARLVASALLALAPAVAHPVAAQMPTVAGLWLTENRGGVIDIASCGDAGTATLCGRIVGLAEFEADGSAPRDWRGGTQCGLRIIEDARLTSDGVWEGRITDPRDGRVYGAELRLDETGRLRLRGYLGLPLLGSTQLWTRYTGGLTRDCHLRP